MKKKDRRITLFLQFFFLLAGIYIIALQGVAMYNEFLSNSIFEVYNARVPAFSIFARFFAGLASLIACWTLWARISWSAGWCMFTLGLLLYHNIYALGATIHSRPAEAIPMIIIILVVMQSFPFLMKQTRRYR